MSINQVTCYGKVVNDPILREVADNKRVCDLRICIEDIVRIAGDFRHTHAYVDVTSWSDLADRARLCIRGTEVLIHGRIASESWEKDGQKRSRVKIVASSLQPCWMGFRQEADQEQITKMEKSK